MPYPFAHPAAVIPLCPLMGRLAVPSALAIGSVVPDLWYFVPGMTRLHSHGMGGLLWFCLPAGLLVYLAFHLLLKQPLIALLPRSLAGRAAHWTARALPPVSWFAVVVSLLAGALTHLGWDALTHASSTSTYLFPSLDQPVLALGEYRMNGYQVMQHGSSLLGGAFVAWWVWRKAASLPAQELDAPVAIPAALRALVIAILVGVPVAAVGAAGVHVSGERLDLVALRHFARTAGFAATAAFVLAALAYCALWHLLAAARNAPGDGAHLAGRGQPDRQRRHETGDDGD